MASQKQNFTRSNVNEETLQISAPNRSSFDLSHRTKFTLPLGRLLPINVEYLMPTDMLRGSLSPNIQLEKIVTPELGRLRMDTHTFAVNARRINNQWRQFAESSRGSVTALQLKPSFNPASLFDSILNHLAGKSSLREIAQLSVWYDSEEGSTAEEFINAFLLAVVQKYTDMIDDYVENQLNGYLSDFFAVERQRIKEYMTLHNVESETDIDLHLSDIPAVIEFVIRPYMGIGSICDMLGYPIYRQYGSSYSAFVSAVAAEETWQDLNDYEFVEIFMLRYTQGVGLSVLELSGVDEMPFRAIYAAWYDYLRNFHIEKRERVLDPDNFGSTSILNSFVSMLGDSTFFAAAQLLLLKYRMFARDGLTTVQEDDKYRHVYVPIYDDNSSDISGFESPDSVGFDSQNILDNALSVVIQNVTTYFPGDGGWGTSDSVDYLRADLQVMKRTSMLYKYLARDFYNPDTYAGFVRARYSIVPDDINFLSSEYLGGDEVMISGEQLKANVTTEDTPAGTRTFTGGGSMSDSFSYRASDYCYLVSFVSLVPLVSYDAANMHMHELSPFDLPLPEFAEDTRVAVKTDDILRGMETVTPQLLGFVPRYYGYRQRIDELHGTYLTDKRSWDWTFDWYSRAKEDILPSSGFALDPYSMRIHLPINAFLGLDEWDDIAYGSCDCKMIIDRPLPAAVEFI